MTTPVGLGVPVPKMLPITGTWAMPFAAYLMILSGRVVRDRVNNQHYLGDSTNVPIALTFAVVAELNGANKKILNYDLGTLLVFRILSCGAWLKGNDDVVVISWPIGYLGTQCILAGLAGYSAYLVKGCWGL